MMFLVFLLVLIGMATGFVTGKMLQKAPIDQGATFVHAVVREILLDATEASKVLGVDKKERKQWEHRCV